MQLATERASSWRANMIRRQHAERTHPVVTRVAYRPDLHEIAATIGLRRRDSARDREVVLSLGIHQRAVLLDALHQRERSRSLAGVLTMLVAGASVVILLGAGQGTSGWWAVPILVFAVGLDLWRAARKNHQALDVLCRAIDSNDLDRTEDLRRAPAAHSREGGSRD